MKQEYSLVTKYKKINRTTGIHAIPRIYLNWDGKQYGPFVDTITAQQAFPRIKEIKAALEKADRSFRYRAMA